MQGNKFNMEQWPIAYLTELVNQWRHTNVNESMSRRVNTRRFCCYVTPAQMKNTSALLSASVYLKARCKNSTNWNSPRSTQKNMICSAFNKHWLMWQDENIWVQYKMWHFHLLHTGLSVACLLHRQHLVIFSFGQLSLSPMLCSTQVRLKPFPLSHKENTKS